MKTTTYEITDLTNSQTKTNQTGTEVIKALLNAKEINTKIIKNNVLAILTFDSDKIKVDNPKYQTREKFGTWDVDDLTLEDFIFNFLTNDTFEDFWKIIDYSNSFNQALISLLQREVIWYKITQK